MRREELERLEEAILNALHRDLGVQSAGYFVSDPDRYRRYCMTAGRAAEIIGLHNLETPGGAAPDAGLFVCSGVLETLEEDQLDAVLSLIRAQGKPTFFFIATRPAKVLQVDGSNPRALIHSTEWWQERLSKYFETLQVMRVPGRQACAFTSWRLSDVGRDLITRHRRGSKRRLSILRMKRRLLNRINLIDRPPKPLSALLRMAEGKRVAVVGNATSLADGDFGALIDGHDIVLRFNLMPIVSARSHGLKTDWVATHQGLSRQFFEARGATTVIWLGNDHKLIPGWTILKAPHFFWIKDHDLTNLKRTLGAPPTAGVALIDLLAQSSATEMSLFGFDFMQSGTLSTWRPTAGADYDFEGEARYVRQLVQEVDRFTVYGAGPDG